MIRYTAHRSVCPHCAATLQYQGNKRFGAPEALCGKCNGKIVTDLTEWAKLSDVRKVTAATMEILLPSFINLQGCQLIILGGIFMQPFFWLMCAIPFILLGSLLFNPSSLRDPISSTFFGIFMLVGLSVYPILLVLRLRKLIAESNSYTKLGTLPIIKASGGGKTTLEVKGYGRIRWALNTHANLGKEWLRAVQMLTEWKADSPAVYEQLLIQALTDQDTKVRKNAANFLSECHGPEVVPALQRALEDPDPAVRKMVEIALRKTEAGPAHPE